MRSLVLVFCLAVFTSTAYAQQFLWTTLKDSSAKYVPIEHVTEKVLELFDHYQYYYDGTGFSKDGFFKMFESSQTFKNTRLSEWRALKQKINSWDRLTVVVFKANLGYGSSVLVMCINKEHVDFVAFSNEYERGAMRNYSFERNKFEKWFKGLLN